MAGHSLDPLGIPESERPIGRRETTHGARPRALDRWIAHKFMEVIGSPPLSLTVQPVGSVATVIPITTRRRVRRRVRRRTPQTLPGEAGRPGPADAVAIEPNTAATIDPRYIKNERRSTCFLVSIIKSSLLSQEVDLHRALRRREVKCFCRKGRRGIPFEQRSEPRQSTLPGRGDDNFLR